MQDRIKELAIEAGMAFNQRIDEFSTPLCDGVHVEQLTRFAQAIARECAEECAKVCEGVDMFNYDDPGSTYATAIRARFGIAKE